MQFLFVFACVLSSVLSAPAKLGEAPGYNYPEPAEPTGLYELPQEPPAEPSGLYEVPVSTTTTTTTTTPPPPPPAAYLPPDNEPEDSNINQIIEKPKMMLMPYEFTYGVQDSDSGNQYTHSVDSDGANVEGEYSVLMPDGRTQVVKFRSTPEEGYTAQVSYI